MTRISGIGAGLALAVLACGHGAFAGEPPAPEQPPAQWAQYLADVKQADGVEGDEARCKAYPDLPGNQWRPGAAQARCSLLRAPRWTLDQIESQLITPDGVAGLERDFAALLDAHYNDQAQREQIFIAYNVFDHTARAGKIAQRWLELAPDSAFANTAAGAHLSKAGWEARGTRWVRDTPQAQLQAMSDLFAKSLPLYMKALAIQPRLSVACVRLHDIGRQSLDALQDDAAAHCLKVDPDSYYVVWSQFMAAQPRWGGSPEEMRQVVAYAAARTDRNPILGALLGEAAGYAPSIADDYGDVVEELAGASRMAPSGTLMSQAARGYSRNEDYWAALVYASQATRFWPRDAAFRYTRAAILTDVVRDFGWARSDMLAAVAQEPTNDSYNYLLAYATDYGGNPAAARPYYKRALNGKWRKRAMQGLCESYMIPQPQPEADSCTASFVEEFPTSADGWYSRTWALMDNDPAGAQAAAERFRALADPANPTHRQNLDSLKSLEKVWESQRKRAKGSAVGK